MATNGPVVLLLPVPKELIRPGIQVPRQIKKNRGLSPTTNGRE
jgi:hypothetical protein